MSTKLDSRLKRIEQRFVGEIETCARMFADWLSPRASVEEREQMSQDLSHQKVSEALLSWLQEYEKQDERSAKIIKSFLRMVK